MKRILAILLAVLMIGTVFALTGCGDNQNAQDNQVNAEKQKEYEKLFNDASKIEMNSKNVSAVGTNDGIKALEVQSKESGDIKMTMYFTENIKYTTYKIDNSSYFEIHFTDYKDSDGKTVKAEDLYYKTNTESKDSENIVTPNVAESLELANKENIKSVKYIETKEIEGVKCDVVEVVHIMHRDSEDVVSDAETILKDSNDSQTEKETEDITPEVEIIENASSETTGENDDSIDKNSESQEQTVELTSEFYFVSDTKKLYGYKAITSGLELECYFVEDLKVELPEGVEFVEADDETINDKMMALYSAAYSMIDNSESSTQ